MCWRFGTACLQLRSSDAESSDSSSDEHDSSDGVQEAEDEESGPETAALLQEGTR